MSDETPYVEFWLEGPRATSIYTRLYKPPASTPVRATLVFLHGYLEHIGRYELIHTKWAARGIAVFTYDQPGFGRTALDEEHKSPKSTYGRTGGAFERMTDIEWAVRHTKGLFDKVPLFLMGHSSAGGMVLGFATRPSGPPSKEALSTVSGIISSSPLIDIINQKPSYPAWLVLRAISVILPDMPLNTPIQDKAFCHDPAVGEAALKDPLCKPLGRLQGIVDMIHRGHMLLKEYKNWPSTMPLLVLHGTDDKMNAFSPTKQFYDLVPASDKEFIAYEGALHDLMTEPEHKDKYFEDCVGWVEKHLAKEA